jgi:predicted transcriptional regulator
MMHPKEREYLDEESTLVVTVRSGAEFHDDVTTNLERLERGESVETPPRLSFHSYDDLMRTFTSSTLDLIATVRRENPASINEAARMVDRDVSTVHEQLTRLESLGVIYFAEEGQSKRPVVWFDDLVIDIPFDEESETADHAVASGGEHA